MGLWIAHGKCFEWHPPDAECETRYHEHDVEDDIVECETIQEEKCEDVTQGYTTEQKCTKWPRQGWALLSTVVKLTSVM